MKASFSSWNLPPAPSHITKATLATASRQRDRISLQHFELRPPVHSTADKQSHHAWLLQPVVWQGFPEPSPGLTLPRGVHSRRWLHGLSSQGLWASLCWERKHLTFGCHAVVSTSDLHKTCGNQNVPVTGVNLSLPDTDLQSGHNVVFFVANPSPVTFLLQRAGRQPSHVNAFRYIL